MLKGVSTCKPLCPSAQPDWPDSVAIGVVNGSSDEPRLRHFDAPISVDDERLALSGPVTPTEVLRFAATCIGSKCAHFQGQQCQLVSNIVQLLPAVVEQLPVCTIRPQCRWWQQEGKAACLRCPQVVTDNYNPSDRMRLAAAPAITLRRSFQRL
jgi:hypothetical protein